MKLAIFIALTALAGCNDAPVYEVTHNGVIITLPACPTEDSANCVWNAQTMGNGRGNSFYDINGEIYPLNLGENQ